jgi:hypothetical protein
MKTRSKKFQFARRERELRRDVMKSLKYIIRKLGLHWYSSGLVDKSEDDGCLRLAKLDPSLRILRPDHHEAGEDDYVVISHLTKDGWMAEADGCMGIISYGWDGDDLKFLIEVNNRLLRRLRERRSRA